MRCLALPALPLGVEIHGSYTEEHTQIGMAMMDECQWGQGSMKVKWVAGNSQHHPLGGVEGAQKRAGVVAPGLCPKSLLIPSLPHLGQI